MHFLEVMRHKKNKRTILETTLKCRFKRGIMCWTQFCKKKKKNNLKNHNCMLSKFSWRFSHVSIWEKMAKNVIKYYFPLWHVRICDAQFTKEISVFILPKTVMWTQPVTTSQNASCDCGVKGARTPAGRAAGEHVQPPGLARPRLKLEPSPQSPCVSECVRPAWLMAA